MYLRSGDSFKFCLKFFKERVDLFELVHTLLDALVGAFLWDYLYIEGQRGYMIHAFVHLTAHNLQVLKKIVLSRDLRMTFVMVSHLEEIIKT